MHRLRIRRIAGAFLPERHTRPWILLSFCISLGCLGLVFALRFRNANSRLSGVQERGASPINEIAGFTRLPLRPGLAPNTRITTSLDGIDVPQALAMYAELTGRTLVPSPGGWGHTLATTARKELGELGFVNPEAQVSSRITTHGDGIFSAAEVKAGLELWFQTNGVLIEAQGTNAFRAEVIKSEGRNPNPEIRKFH
jgi:hypothetical protein